MNTIDKIIESAQIFCNMIQMFEEDFTMGIADLDKFVAYYPGKTLNFGIKKYDVIKSGSSARVVFETKKPATKIMDASVYGITYYAGAVPILEGSQVIGAITFGVSLNQKNKLMEISNSLSSFVTEVTASTSEIEEAAKELSNKNDYINTLTAELNKQTQATSSLVSSISQIASQTKMLGLNASIEAARAGDFGRGFNVVAQEMRKMAVNSEQSVHQIVDILTHIQGEIQELGLLVQESNRFAKNQFEQIKELNIAMNTVSDEALALQKLAKYE